MLSGVDFACTIDGKQEPNQHGPFVQRPAPSASMASPIKVAILGFSTFERSALAAHFRIAQERSPCYTIVLDIDEATFVVADAEQSGVYELLRELGRLNDTLFVGAGAPAEAAAWTMRPIDPGSVMREFDRLLRLRENLQLRVKPLGLPSVPGGLRPIDSGAGALSPPPMPARRAEDLVAAAGRSAAARRAARVVPTESPLRRALLVDDSEVALHFLRRRLEPYGVKSEFAYDSTDALGELAKKAYGLVFLDVDLGEGSELDGLGLCKRIKSRQAAVGGAPVIVLVSAFHEAVHRVRGTLAGADAFLAKPLDPAALEQLLGGLGLRRRAPATPV